MVRCKGKTLTDRRCRNNATDGEEYCSTHMFQKGEEEEQEEQEEELEEEEEEEEEEVEEEDDRLIKKAAVCIATKKGEPVIYPEEYDYDVLSETVYEERNFIKYVLCDVYESDLNWLLEQEGVGRSANQI